MKKLASIGIMLFILAYVLTAGFLIIRTSVTSGYSNAQLLADFLAPTTKASAVSITHLTDPTSVVTQPNYQQALANNTYSEMSPITTANSTTIDATGSSTDPADSSTFEQNFEVLAATLVHLH